MWIEAIVMPREDEARPARSAPRRNRRTVHLEGCQESQRFRTAVLHYLKAQRLMNSVKWVSEPGSLPMVTLHCHEGVLERLRQAPQFAAGRSLGVELHS